MVPTMLLSTFFDTSTAGAAMMAVKSTAEDSLDVGSWTKKVLSNDMFSSETGGAEAQLVLQTSGLCTKEEVTLAVVILTLA